MATCITAVGGTVLYAPLPVPSSNHDIIEVPRGAQIGPRTVVQSFQDKGGHIQDEDYLRRETPGSLLTLPSPKVVVLHKMSNACDEHWA